MNEEIFYSRINTFFNIEKKDFKKLKGKSIAVLGCGGIGSYTAEFLAKYGFNLTLVDYDLVDESNISRQNYNYNDLDKPKVERLKEKLKRTNPNIKIKTFNKKFSSKNYKEILSESDIVLDCFDNMESKMILNDACLKLKIPFIHMAAISRKGNLLFVEPDNDYCLSCLYKKPNFEADKCESIGVLSHIPTIIGLLSIDLIINYFLYNSIEKKLIRINFKNLSLTKIELNKRENCESCTGNYPYLKKIEHSEDQLNFGIEKLCGKDSFQLNLPDNHYNSFLNYLKKGNVLMNNKHFIKSKVNYINNENKNIQITLFKDGRVLINGLKYKKDVKKIINSFCGD
ncbi:MAG: HesA/MoeB/ThiF family protein [Candidatus Woesearchaeota archaeon]